jgi:hypothetical protein
MSGGFGPGAAEEIARGDAGVAQEIERGAVNL